VASAEGRPGQSPAQFAGGQKPHNAEAARTDA